MGKERQRVLKTLLICLINIHNFRMLTFKKLKRK
jgi:hypothetical protein